MVLLDVREVDGMGRINGSTEAALIGRAGLESDTVAATERGRGGWLRYWRGEQSWIKMRCVVLLGWMDWMETRWRGCWRK